MESSILVTRRRLFVETGSTIYFAETYLLIVKSSIGSRVSILRKKFYRLSTRILGASLPKVSKIDCIVYEVVNYVGQPFDYLDLPNISSRLF